MNAAVLTVILSTAYNGCLLFQDDIRPGDDLSLSNAIKPSLLIRSWYRFGEPHPEKAYTLRGKFVEKLRNEKITVGGGTSLSVINDRDIARSDFDPAWMSVGIDGKALTKDGEKYAALSAPGFRSYLVKRLLEQVRLGVVELALGETTGKIHYDDWSLGIKGDDGFVHWITKKYAHQSALWWKENFGALGVAIVEKKTITRVLFQNLKDVSLSNFQLQWGTPDSWHGTNEKGEPVFLAYIYRKNLESFIKELKSELKNNNFEKIAIDIWGVADWMKGSGIKPDAVLNSPPDERWGIPWNTDPDFDVAKNRDRIKKIMMDEVKSVAPATMVYMFDHPRPFLTSFVKLSDERQAYLTRFFAQLSSEVKAKFALRSYSEISGGAGPKTKEMIRELCDKLN